MFERKCEPSLKLIKRGKKHFSANMIADIMQFKVLMKKVTIYTKKYKYFLEAKIHKWLKPTAHVKFVFVTVTDPLILELF